MNPLDITIAGLLALAAPESVCRGVTRERPRLATALQERPK